MYVKDTIYVAFVRESMVLNISIYGLLIHKIS